MKLTSEDSQILIDLLKKEINAIDKKLAELQTNIKHLQIAMRAKEAGFVIIKE